jgi:two-component system, response regulator YesN
MPRLGTRRRSHVFAAYLVSYLLVLALPFSLGIVAFYRVSLDLRRNLVDETISVLESRIILLDQRMKELDDFVSQLSLDSRVRSFMGRPSAMVTGSSVPAVLDLQRYLAVRRIGDSFLHTFHVYFNTGQSVLTPDRSYIDMAYFYGPYFRFEQMSDAEWFALLYGTFHQRTVLPLAEVTFGERPVRALTLIQSIPLNRASLNRGAIVLFVAEDQLLSHLLDPSFASGHLFVRDAQGRILLTTMSADAGESAFLSDARSGTRVYDVSMAGTASTAYTAISSHTGWEFVLVLDSRAVTERLQSVTGLMWIVFAISSLIGVLIAYLMAYRNSRPLVRLAEILTSGIASRRTQLAAMNDVVDYVDRLQKQGEELEHTVRMQRPLLQAAFVESLLRGSFVSAPEIQRYRAQLGMPELLDTVVVTVFRWNDSRSLESANHRTTFQLKTAALRQTISAAFGGAAYIYDMDFSRITVILSFAREQSDKAIRTAIRSTVRNVENAVYGRSQSGQLTVGVGIRVESLEKIPHSFETACHALEYRQDDEATDCCWFDDLPRHGNACYPLEIETELMNAVRAAKRDLVEHNLRILHARNFVEQRLPLQEQQQFIFDIRHTLSSLIVEAVGTDLAEKPDHARLLQELDGAVTIRELFETLTAAFGSICDCFAARKKSHNAVLAEKMTAFIDTHYTDPQLYLPVIASELGITKEYASQFFKEQTGEKYSSYLERKRIEHAIDLLSNGSYQSLAEVAARSGYASPQVFRRAFRRITGTAPSQFAADNRSGAFHENIPSP